MTVNTCGNLLSYALTRRSLFTCTLGNGITIFGRNKVNAGDSNNVLQNSSINWSL